jgi:predicted PurR-regulated permease PerM
LIRSLEAAGILALLAVFFSYLLAPAVDAIRRVVNVGRRQRPLPRAAAILLVYAMLFVPGACVWRQAAPPIERWVHVTAPAAIAHVFVSSRVPIPPHVNPLVARAATGFFAYIERQVRRALDDLIAAAEYARWLAVTPVIAFVLLAYAPGFRRSALRVLPHGHLRWRGEEYFRDVNSALAGYTRAQLAAGLIVGASCAAAFTVFALPNAISTGVVAGSLELVPVIGPLTVVVLAAGQADHPFVVVLFLAAFRVVQDYVVYPRLIRRGMHLSSIAVIVSVWIGAALQGAAGVMLAIPFAGCLSVSLRHWREYSDIERLVRSKGSPDADLSRH